MLAQSKAISSLSIVRTYTLCQGYALLISTTNTAGISQRCCPQSARLPMMQAVPQSFLCISCSQKSSKRHAQQISINRPHFSLDLQHGYHRPGVFGNTQAPSEITWIDRVTSTSTGSPRCYSCPASAPHFEVVLIWLDSQDCAPRQQGH